MGLRGNEPIGLYGAELALELGSDVGRRVGRVQREVEQRDQGRKASGASGTETVG